MLTDLIAPTTCVGCGAPGDDLCAPCAERVIVVEPKIVLGGASFDSAHSLVAFAEPARALTLRLKRRGTRAIAGGIGSLLAALVRREGLCPDVVTHVPAARGRGFDHAELIARSAARDLDLPARALLRRKGRGPRQADVALEQRRANVADRFVARASPARVLLVDDVFTTGATAEACASVLKRSGASNVDVVTWARTLLRRETSRSVAILTE